MELTTLWSGLGSISLDDLLVWAVAVLAGIVGLIAMVNALDMLLEADAVDTHPDAS